MRIIADQNIPFAHEAFGCFGEVTTLPGRYLQAADVAAADILLVRSVTRVNPQLLDGSKVRFVGTATAGIDHIDTDYLATRSIAFASAPGSNARSVAEYVVSALLGLLGERREVLAGRTAGIIGYGHVGSQVETLLSVMGCQCCRNDPPRERSFHDGPYVELEQALQADIVSVHVPLSTSGFDRTLGLLDTDHLALLGPESILINTARGGVINEEALQVYALAHPDFRMILDCWVSEPDISEPLLKRASIGTPHIAGYSYTGKLRATGTLHNALARFLEVQPCWTVPVPTAPRIGVQTILAAAEVHPEQALAATVTACYDPRADTLDLRHTMDLPVRQRGKAFDELRRRYPVRHEFGDFVFDLSAFPQGSELRTKLTGLGFGRA